MSDLLTLRPAREPAAHAAVPSGRLARVDWRIVGPVGLLLTAIGVVSAWKMGSAPLVAKDEGVYMSQAWAVTHMGSLANYTYWYDHPPLGWVFLSAWVESTFGLVRYHDSVMAGREFMVVLHVVSSGLVYVLGRRLGFRRSAAALACAAYGFSPLSVYFGRLVLLDNIAVPFVLGAFVLATTPRRRTSAFVGAAVLMGLGVLCKETVLLLAPFLVWTIARQVESRRRVLVLALALGTLVMTVAFYPLYATLKNELLPGTGHVSLTWAVQWQLFSRASSGNVLEAGSDARALVDQWTGLDSILLVAGVVGALVTVLPRCGQAASRPIAAALALQVLMVLRPGYLPFPYVIAVLPFAALLVGAAADTAIRLGARRLGPEAGAVRRRALDTYRVVAAGTAAVAQAAVAVVWWQGVGAMQAVDQNRPLADTRAWIDANTTPSSVGVVEASLWLDLVDDGRLSPKPIWMYKLDQDPAVKAELGGWQSVDYLALQNDTLEVETRSSMPTMFDALDHATVAARFGSGDSGYTVFVVDPNS